MTMLRRWDPFSELARWQDAMDWLVEERSPWAYGWGRQGHTIQLPLDVAETEDAFLVHASVPGVNPDDLEITVNENVLTIKGETQSEQEREGQRFHLRERSFGSFTRSIALPATIERDSIGATFENGVLTLSLPKSEASKPKRININRSNTIEDQSSYAMSGDETSTDESGMHSGEKTGYQRTPEQQRAGSNGGGTVGGATMEGAEGRPR